MSGRGQKVPCQRSYARNARRRGGTSANNCNWFSRLTRHATLAATSVHLAKDHYENEFF